MKTSLKIFLPKQAAILLLIVCLFWTTALFSKENFLLIDGALNTEIYRLGRHVEEQVSPCSTFKIALSLMGFDAGVLQDSENPTWQFQQGYEEDLAEWKQAQTPQSWIKYSCVWFSKILVAQLGTNKFRSYVDMLQYGNRDISNGSTTPWLCSSLKISPKEQVEFIRQMLSGNLPIAQSAIQMTKELLYIEDLQDGWKLYGKTGWSGSTHRPDGKNELAWFVGWIERKNRYCPFSYSVSEVKVNLPMRIPRVKQLLAESNLY